MGSYRETFFLCIFATIKAIFHEEKKRRMFFYVIAISFILVNLKISSYAAETCRYDQISVRLVNGTSERNGRVELCWDNQWKAVCDDGWDQGEAITVCRELGYLNSNGGAIAVTGSHFGDAQEIHLLKQWNCRSSDTSLAYCSKSRTIYPCCPSETAGVYCPGGSNCNDGEIRLNGGQSQTEGIVEICFGVVWGTICHDGWDDSDAKVACQQLGYSQGYVTMNVEYDREAHTIRHLSHVSCTGNESRLADCSHEGIGVHTCEGNYAAVMCIALPQTTIGRDHNQSTTITLTVTESPHSKNSSSISPSLTRNEILIIIGCITCSAVLLTVLVVVPTTAVVYGKKRRHQQKIQKSQSVDQDTPVHIYDEITTIAECKRPGTVLTKSHKTINTEQKFGSHIISTAVLPTSDDDEYEYMV